MGLGLLGVVDGGVEFLDSVGGGVLAGDGAEVTVGAVGGGPGHFPGCGGGDGDLAGWGVEEYRAGRFLVLCWFGRVVGGAGPVAGDRGVVVNARSVRFDSGVDSEGTRGVSCGEGQGDAACRG